MNIYTDPVFMEDMMITLVPALLSGVPSFLFGIATYVLSALALYTVARRRGIRKAWLSWVPVLNVWILGSLSDQYRYVVKGQIRSKRKILLALSLVGFLCGAAVFGIGTFAVVRTICSILDGNTNHFIMNLITTPVIAAAGFGVPMLLASAVQLVIRYMALYDIYTSMDPGNNVLFLVLSIFFRVTEPFFLFFNRNKDGGMPPRRETSVSEEPRYQPEENV